MAVAISGASAATARAENATVDQLIKKLPPPESVARSTVALDPALRDPLSKQMIDSAKSMNFGNALSLSQQLANRYPKSAAAQYLHGQLALILRRFPEASTAFRKALSDNPNFAIAYLGLGMTEAWQNRFAAAMSDYRQVTRLAPQKLMSVGLP